MKIKKIGGVQYHLEKDELFNQYRLRGEDRYPVMNGVAWFSKVDKEWGYVAGSAAEVADIPREVRQFAEHLAETKFGMSKTNFVHYTEVIKRCRKMLEEFKGKK